MLDLKNITSNNMNSLTEENYLKAIFHLLDSENQVTVNELSKFLL
jgi:DtxR family Mn-dependent transcriptional regulator